MTPFDWVIVALYAVGMLAIGWWYSGKVTTTEDYLLGGRNMRPWAVGLSMFASLVSVLTYLGWPGEMIRHGPMILSQILAYPFIVAVVGWLIIPRIMGLKVTSAYEILETRLGLPVRLTGSLLFLTLRTIWMGVVLYATADLIVKPMLGLEESAVPLICALLGVLTLTYTALGGLRAVVLTDVIQSLILFGGALAAVAVVTVRLGGVEAWWPAGWYDHWSRPALAFDPAARITVLSALSAHLVWFVCTSGSDQMAIQRYLATRDVRAARRTLFVSAAADIVIVILLGLLGLALLAYFSARPDLVPAGAAIDGNADRLLPSFLVYGFPPGITGILIAALLAASMSSLSSGMNSCCSVITVDFVQRFRREPMGVAQSLKTARLSSLAVGLLIVGLSFLITFVEGNLVELAYKLVNLLVAPLFVLFFMALFVPWASCRGTLVAAAAGVVSAVAISFFGVFGLGFMWIMPGSLLVGIGVGAAASLLWADPPRPWLGPDQSGDITQGL